MLDKHILKQLLPQKLLDLLLLPIGCGLLDGGQMLFFAAFSTL